MIDESLTWKYHIAFVCSRISQNIGIISKLRYYLSIQQLKQIYYNLIYPYISYSILAWGSVYKTHIKKIQVNQNHTVHNGLLPRVFDNTLQYARNIHRYNSGYTAKQNFYKYKIKTNAGKQSVSYMAIDIWKDLLSSLKDLSVFAFPKHIKRYVLNQNKNRTSFLLNYFKFRKSVSHLFISVIFYSFTYCCNSHL